MSVLVSAASWFLLTRWFLRWHLTGVWSLLFLISVGFKRCWAVCSLRPLWDVPFAVLSCFSSISFSTFFSPSSLVPHLSLSLLLPVHSRSIGPRPLSPSSAHSLLCSIPLFLLLLSVKPPLKSGQSTSGQEACWWCEKTACLSACPRVSTHTLLFCGGCGAAGAASRTTVGLNGLSIWPHASCPPANSTCSLIVLDSTHNLLCTRGLTFLAKWDHLDLVWGRWDLRSWVFPWSHTHKGKTAVVEASCWANCKLFSPDWCFGS